MRPRSLVVLLATVASILAPPAVFAQQAAPPETAAPADAPLGMLVQPGRHGAGSLAIIEREGARIPILTLVGTAAERGEQHGTLLQPALQEMVRWMDRDLSLKGALFATTTLRRRLFDALPEEVQTETRALQQAAGIPAAQAEFMQVASDLFKAFGCSVVIADERAGGGEFLFGRNLDYRNFVGRFHETSIVYRVKPDEGNAYVAVGFMGQVGVLSGMNEHGLTLCTLEISDRGLEPGTPYMARYRELLRRCRTLDEALTLVRTQQITTNNALAVADRSGAIGVFEQASEQVELRRPDAGSHRLWQTNHYCLETMFPFEGRRGIPDRDAAHKVYDSGSVGRFNIIERRCAPATVPAGKLTRADVIASIHEANQGEATVQSMIFHPATGAVDVAFGTPPTSGLPFARLSAAELWDDLRGAAPVPAVPTRVAPAPPPARAAAGADEEF